MEQKIGILGGTFNPIHYGHLAAAEEVRDRLKLDRVLFIPSFLPPHKEDAVPPARQRLEMVRLAISGNPQFKLSDIEVKRGGKSYTIDTIDTLLSSHPGAELYFIAGLDSFMEIATWKDWRQVLSRCCFVVLSRPGYRFVDLMKLPFLQIEELTLNALDRRANMSGTATVDGQERTIYLEDIPVYDISSTDIRNRIAAGRTVKYHLPDAVETYIIENKLYA